MQEPDVTLQFFFRLLPIYDVTTGIMKLYDSSWTSDLCRKISAEQLFFICLADDDNMGPIVPCCPKSKCSNWRGENVCLDMDHPFRWDGNGIGKELTMMFVSFTIFLVAVCLMDLGIIRALKRMISRMMPGDSSPPDETDDSDVGAEKQRIYSLIQSGGVSSEALVADSLCKRFNRRDFVVKNVTFGVHKQECFGLLGVNGAGKTTTFSEYFSLFLWFES